MGLLIDLTPMISWRVNELVYVHLAHSHCSLTELLLFLLPEAAMRNTWDKRCEVLWKLQMIMQIQGIVSWVLN